MNVDVRLVRVYSLKVPVCLIPHPRFKEQIYDVYRYLPPATQVVLINATLPMKISR